MKEDPDIERILSDPRSREYRDLRNRAAYMYITGTYPSHLRTYFTRALGLISRVGDCGMVLDADIAQRLKLEDHPMVAKVREHVRDGWKIRASRGPNSRKPYTKVFMFKGAQRRTVQIDESIKDSWD